jgi:hypothetical protein
MARIFLEVRDRFVQFQIMAVLTKVVVIIIIIIIIKK